MYRLGQKYCMKFYYFPISQKHDFKFCYIPPVQKCLNSFIYWFALKNVTFNSVIYWFGQKMLLQIPLSCLNLYLFSLRISSVGQAKQVTKKKPVSILISTAVYTHPHYSMDQSIHLLLSYPRSLQLDLHHHIPNHMQEQESTQDEVNNLSTRLTCFSPYPHKCITRYITFRVHHLHYWHQETIVYCTAYLSYHAT